MDIDRLKKARIHPFSVLLALKTYQSGHGDKGKLQWNPVQQVVNALDSAFYASFAAVEPTNKRWLLAIDVSGSMGWGSVNGASCINPMIASAAMAMVTANTESRHHFLGFSHKLVPLDISKRDRLDLVVEKIQQVPMGGTDCAQPMLYAIKNKLDVDVFVVYTDCETWAGAIHPSKALEQYRQVSGIDAKMIIVGMTSNGFTIADPKDSGQLDMVGFDAGAPQIMSDFVMGRI